MIGNILLSLAIAAAQPAKPPSQVSALVAPVLNAHDGVAKKDDESTEESLDLVLDKVLATKTGFGDEALAILLGYYIGEHSAEEVSCELVARGRSVLFYLKKYSNAEVAVVGVRETHKRTFGQYEEVRKRIESGEKCEREM